MTTLCEHIRNHIEQHSCPVCYETTHHTLSCGHLLCSNCADRWFDNHSNCPLCRREIRRHNENTGPLSDAQIDRLIRQQREKEDNLLESIVILMILGLISVYIFPSIERL